VSDGRTTPSAEPHAFSYAPMPDVGLPMRERLGQYPRVPDITFDALRTAARWIAVGLTKLQFPIEVRGEQPLGDRVAFVANHQSHLDSLVLLASLSERRRREIACLAAKDYFFENSAVALASSLFVMAVAFDRTRYTELRRWTRILREQRRGTLLVYPSGSRRRSEVHDAILFVLASSGWSIVPVAIAGSAKAWPVGKKVWRPFHRVRVTFGPPLSATPTKDLGEALAAFWTANT
jgi:1-acyl-sn-glycerol-3-phosphate acyltransferase